MITFYVLRFMYYVPKKVVFDEAARSVIDSGLSDTGVITGVEIVYAYSIACTFPIWATS